MRQNLDEQLKNEVVKALAVHPGILLEIGAEVALCLVSALQLALRHPGYPDSTRPVVESFARRLGERLATSGPLAVLLEGGWNTEQDETAAQMADPAHRESVAAEVFAAAERAEAKPATLTAVPTTGLRIDTLYAYVGIDPTDGAEGICAVMTDQGWMPLVCADAIRASALRPLAEGVAKQTGDPITLVRFRARQEMGSITP